MDGADRARRAEILALAAADATFLDDARDERRRIVALHLTHHRDGAGGTMGRAATAAGFPLAGEAEIVIHDGTADMDHGLLLFIYRENRSGRAYLRAVGALRAAEAAVEVHLGLHQVTGIGTRTEHIVGAVGHAQLTGSTMLVEVLGALSPGRDEALLALGSLLRKDGGKAAVGLLRLLGMEQRGGAGKEGTKHEGALAGVGSRNGLGRRLGAIGEAIFQCALGALLDTVEADYATRAVDLMGFSVDAGCLAVLVAFAAGNALALIDGHAEEREPRNETQCGSDGADIVAP